MANLSLYKIQTISRRLTVCTCLMLLASVCASEHDTGLRPPAADADKPRVASL
jgi:hypothetical protein